MAGKGRSGALAVRSPEPLLSLVAPIGMAASRTTGLVVDLAGGLDLVARRTLADILADGPRLDELSPGHPGVALLSAGPVGVEEAVEAIDQLASRWPGVVVRVEDGQWPGPTVPVLPLYPGLLANTSAQTAVWQPTAAGFRAPGPGPVLPRLGGRLARRLLSGHMPGRGRWVRAWRQVWDLPWA